MDSADYTLLNLLQENARQNLEILSEKSGLSIASVQRRLKKLREDGVIEKEIAVLDPEKTGYPMTFIVMVEMEREQLDQLDAFKRVARADKQVQQCYYVTGEADFCLICIAENMSDFEALTHRLFFGNRNVRRFRTSVVMDRTKTGLSIPLQG